VPFADPRSVPRRTDEDPAKEINMGARIDFTNSRILQDFAKRLNATSAVVPKGTLPPGLANLVLTRASQINGCAVCVDMHTKDAEQDWETSVRLNLVAAWRDANVFTDAERAALELTEQATRIADAAGGVSEEAWANAASYYNSDQLAALVTTIAVINAYNRFNVMLKNQGGGYEPGQWA
jgi:AhpD family alkylhydroperoxidase